MSHDMKLLNLGLIGAALFAIAPARADAQSEFKDRTMDMVRKVGIHLNVSERHPIDNDVTKGQTFGISIGLSPGRNNGWKFPVGITMFSEDLHSPNGEEFAVMNSKAVMAGIGYGWHFGRLSTGAQLQTGFALNGGRIDGDVGRAFAAPDGAVSIHVGNSMLLRPQVKAEYFLTEKLTLRASADYMRLRPDINVTTPTERLTDRWNASNVHANIGIGFYPWRR
jgi:hypothetical protein